MVIEILRHPYAMAFRYCGCLSGTIILVNAQGAITLVLPWNLGNSSSQVNVSESFPFNFMSQTESRHVLKPPE